MKKISKALSLFSILLLLAAGMFTACAGDDDDGSEPTPTPKPGPTPEPAPSEYTVSFSADGTSTYVDGVYTLIAKTATEAGSTWANQIWISNPNKTAGVAAGDKIHATITVKSDKAISGFFFKDEFNSGSYSGIDNGASVSGLEANVSKTIDLYGKVADDYSADKSRFVIDLRGNEANTTLVLSDVKVEKLGDYDITKLTVVPSSASASSGEKVTLTTVDQYGFPVEGVTYAITSAGTVSTLDGNIFTAGTTAETVTIKATLGTLSATVDIIVTVEKNYGKYFTAENADQHGEEAAKENPGYAFLWSQNTLSDVSATEKEYKFTRSSTSEWYGTQVFYAAEAGKYAVTFKLTSSAAGAITVNHTAYNLEANTAKEIAFIKELDEKNTLISIQLGVDGVSVLPAGTFTISDFTVADASSVTVESVQVVPSATSAFAGSDVTLLATVNNKYFVSGAKFNVADGEGVTGSAIKDNTLTLGNGKGEVSVTATYGDKTSAPVKITVTSYQPPSQDEMGGFYRYFVTTKVGATKITAEPNNWSSGAQISTNDDSTLTLTSAKMWGGDEGVVLAYNSLATGMFAKYTYIVFTVNPASFTLNKSYGVKVKVAKAGDGQPAVEKVFTTNCVLNNGGTVTYFIPLSEYSSVVSVADQFAIIAGGTGSLDVKEVFISAKEDPDVVPPAPTYNAPDLSAFYKKYFVTTKTDVTKIAASLDTWGSGTTATPNETDGTLKLDASASMWGGISGATVALNLPYAGFLAKYDYLVLTLDMSSFTLITEGANSGVNIKIPEVQNSILNNYVENADGTRTYYAKISDFNSASAANQVALIAGGSGSLVVKEVFIAAEKDPDVVTFPYVVPSFTGKGDNGYTTIVKASDIPSDATKVTIVIDNTKCSRSGNDEWWFGYGVSSWLGKVEWDAGINGYKAEITGDTLSAIKAGGLALVATDGLVCTYAITVSVSKDTPAPAPSGDALPVIPAGNGNRKTQIEGAGIWIYLDNTSLGITGANASEIHDASTVSIKDHATSSPVTLSSWEFNDYPTDGKTVRLLANMPNADHTTVDVDISLKIGTKVYTGTVSFVNGVYQFDYKPTEINVSASATEVKPGDTVTFTVKGTPYDIDITDKCEFVILLGDTTGSTISGKTLTAGSTNGTLTVTAKYGELSKNISITVSAAALPTIMSTSKIDGAGVMIWISKDVVATTPAKEDVTVTGKLATTDADYQKYVSDNLSLNIVEVVDQGAQTYIYFTQPAGFPNGAAITETFVIKWGKVTVNAVFDGNALKSSSVEVAN